MGPNPWVNLSHLEFELTFVAKNIVLLNMGNNEPNSLNPWVKQVQVELEVFWPVTHQQQPFVVITHQQSHDFD